MLRGIGRAAHAFRPDVGPQAPVPLDGIIRRPGRYRLDRDIQAARQQPGIDIRAGKVLLDLGGHRVTAAAGSFVNPTYAIRAADISDVTICNGTLSGGWCGVHLLRTQACAMTGILVEDSDHIGIVSIAGRDLRIAGCHLKVVVKQLPLPAGERYTIGMNLKGDAIVVCDTVVEVACADPEEDERPIETIAILIGADSRDVRVTGNRIVASRPLPASYGVWSGTRSVIEVSGNRIENVDYGVAVADEAVASVSDNAFSCTPDPTRVGGSRICSAAMFARAADLRENGNRIDGYTAEVTRYDPVAAGHQ